MFALQDLLLYASRLTPWYVPEELIPSSTPEKSLNPQPVNVIIVPDTTVTVAEKVIVEDPLAPTVAEATVAEVKSVETEDVSVAAPDAFNPSSIIPAWIKRSGLPTLIVEEVTFTVVVFTEDWSEATEHKSPLVPK
tara:strand:+ start:65 stop:472 length:408 start_codon:yes stop_codon:yes gene_type:complete